MIQVPFFLMAKRLSIADEKLKVARVGLIDMRIVNLIDDSMAEGEPNSATGVIRRADAFLRAGSPARLDPWRAKRQ